MKKSFRKIRGINDAVRTLPEALRDRGAADFREGVKKCPFNQTRLKDSWLAGWAVQCQVELEGYAE